MRQKIKLTFLLFLFLLTIFVFATSTTSWNASETLKEINAKLLGTTQNQTQTTPQNTSETSILLRSTNISSECINSILSTNNSPAAGSGGVWISSAKKYEADYIITRNLSHFKDFSSIIESKSPEDI